MYKMTNTKAAPLPSPALFEALLNIFQKECTHFICGPNFFLGGEVAVQCFKFDPIFKILTKIQHNLLH